MVQLALVNDVFHFMLNLIFCTTMLLESYNYILFVSGNEVSTASTDMHLCNTNLYLSTDGGGCLVLNTELDYLRK